MMDRYFYFKLYNNQHELMENCEIHIFNNVSYTNTLNGLGDISFSSPTNYLNTNNIELISGMHIELMLVEGNIEKCIWYGVVVNVTVEGMDKMVVCSGYKELLNKRLFTDMLSNIPTAVAKGEEPVLEDTYYDKTYGDLISRLINRINLISPTGIIMGKIVDTDLKTTRIINWNDDLGEKIDELITDCGCYFTIDRDRRFNFYKEYGENKSAYYEINDQNLISTSTFVIDDSSIYNSIYALNVYTPEGENQATQYLLGTAKDEQSIQIYGLREMELSVNDLREQSSIDQYVQNELAKSSKPVVNITLEVGISDEFNIFDINVGDTINLNSNELNINTPIRVLEYTVDLNRMTVNITVGNTIFRDANYIKYRY